MGQVSATRPTDRDGEEAPMIVASEPVVVAPWTGGPTIKYHDDVWDAWLHGSVAAIHNAGRLLLVVPVSSLSPAAVSLAMRLYDVGSVVVLD
jgi:hypothetical protein